VRPPEPGDGGSGGQASTAGSSKATNLGPYGHEAARTVAVRASARRTADPAPAGHRRPAEPREVRLPRISARARSRPTTPRAAAASFRRPADRQSRPGLTGRRRDRPGTRDDPGGRSHTSPHRGTRQEFNYVAVETARETSTDAAGAGESPSSAGRRGPIAGRRADGGITRPPTHARTRRRDDRRVLGRPDDGGRSPAASRRG